MQRRRATVIAALGLLVGVVFLALGGVVGAILDDAPRKPSTTTVATIPTTTTTLLPIGSLGDAGPELEALVTAGRKVTYHALYSVDDPELPGLVQTLEVWRRGDDFRSEIVTRGNDGQRRQTQYTDGVNATVCQTVEGEETCRVATSQPTDLPAAFIKELLLQEPLPELTVREDDVAGYVAECFVAADVGEICLAGDGVMLSMELNGAVVLNTLLEDDVPDAAFDLPGVRIEGRDDADDDE